jgi:hypothetical protein
MSNRAFVDPLKKLTVKPPSARRLELESQDVRADAVTNDILKLVTQEDYPKAAEHLKSFLELRPEYPQFKQRSERYISYAIDLVNGIKAKRNLAGVKQLASAKQQELYDKALAHFDDLRKTLKKVERIEHEVKLEDMRSTIWVVRAFGYCMLAILIFFFLLEVSQGVLEGANVVADDIISNAVDKLFDTLGI